MTDALRQITLIAILIRLSIGISGATQQSYPPEHQSWNLDSEQVSLESIDDRQAIKIETGLALLEGVSLENGTVEFDVLTSGERSFVYLYFRGQSKQEYEAFYIRPHNSKAPDAIQYAPAFQGRSAWQLYHGDSGTASVEIPANKWIKVKVRLAGQKAEFWVGDTSVPSMVINDLGHESKAGFLAFRGFVPRGSDAKYSAYFSNLRVTKSGDTEPNHSEITLPQGQITQWRVSPAFSSESGPIINLPLELETEEWTTPPMQKNGSFEFLRSRTIPKGSRHWSVAADVSLKSENAQTCAISFGFSDELTVLVNDQPVLYQDNSYRYSDRRQQGVMHPEQLIAYVPLKKGNNSLRAIVSDRFGGWGLSARLSNCKGVVSL